MPSHATPPDSKNSTHELPTPHSVYNPHFLQLRAVNEPPRRPPNLHTRAVHSHRIRYTDLIVVQLLTLVLSVPVSPTSSPYLHDQVISHILCTAPNSKPRSCCSATHAPPHFRSAPASAPARASCYFFHCLYPALPPSPQAHNLKRRVRCRHLGCAVLLLRTHSPDPGRFALCTSRHPLAPEAYESHGDFILEIDMANSPSLVPSVMSCDPRLPRPGHKFMGPVCTAPIHLTTESTLSLTVSLTTQQLTSFCSRTFKYRSIEKQAFCLLLNPIPTNVPTCCDTIVEPV